MATYLYCVLSEAAPPRAGLSGIDGGAIRAIDAGGLHAWVSDVDGTVSPTVERVKAHDAVCASALDARETPLPIRFGQIFGDDSATVDAIASRERSLRARLDRIAGCVEMRVVVTRGRVEQPAHGTATGASRETADGVSSSGSFAGPGTAFLERLAREGRADLAREVGCEEIRHAVRTAGRSLVVDHEPCESARGMSFFPVLIRRTDVAEFSSTVAGIESGEAVGLSVLGPFAPYSFAGDA